MKRGFRVLTLLLLVTAVAGFRASEAPVKDRSLEKRLTVRTSYRTRGGETLASVANLLWGHKTWWRRLKKDNPSLKKYGPEQALPAGVKIRYLAPQVGNDYVVRKNDWLIRIVQWKYGDTELWEKIYHKNSKTIENPNLIHPGDHLVLRTDGTVKNVKTGQIVVQGLQSPLPQTQSQSPAEGEGIETRSAFVQSGAFVMGLGVGILVLALLVLQWWSRRPLLREPPPVAVPPDSARPVAAVTEMEEEVEEPAVAEEDPRGFPYTFKKRPPDDLEPDFSQLGEVEDGEIDRRPNYHSISGKRSRRSLKPALKRPTRPISKRN